MHQAKRLAREVQRLAVDPPQGAVCYPVGDDLRELEAKLQPMADTPYADGVFTLRITVGERYPNEAPTVRFVTPVYHPNIDSEGRICLNLLKMPPKGVWSPAYDLCAVLTGVQILLAQPNPDDPLMTDITDEYRTDLELFKRKAREATLKHATADSVRAAAVPAQPRAVEAPEQAAIPTTTDALTPNHGVQVQRVAVVRKRVKLV